VWHQAVKVVHGDVGDERAVTGRYRTRAGKPYLFGKMEIPLGDVADFIAQEISQRQYLRQPAAIAQR